MILTCIGFLIFGFFAGLFSSKVKNRWCPECGATTYELKARR